MRYDVTAGMTSLFYQVGNQNYYLSPLEKVIFTKTCHWLSISYKDKKYDSGLFQVDSYLFIIIIILITYYLLILGLWFSLFFRILLSLTQKTYFDLCFQMLCRFIPQETAWWGNAASRADERRSEEHTSELQSPG